jgi:hypothetical protein
MEAALADRSWPDRHAAPARIVERKKRGPLSNAPWDIFRGGHTGRLRPGVPRILELEYHLPGNGEIVV